MQQPSPALSSPSTGFFGPRASPLFTQTVDQPESSTLNSAPPTSAPVQLPSIVPEDGPQAPPKQLAQAMEGLSHALRLIAEIRLGSDILMEALQRATDFKAGPVSGTTSSMSVKKASEFVVRTGDAISASMEALRDVGKKLEALGVLSGAQQRFEEKHPWGLQVPLICSDGAIVAYSWKRQIAGQAAASAVERTRLALKEFTDQKKHYFPRFGEDSGDSANKKAKTSADVTATEEVKADDTSQRFLDLLKSWQAEGSGMSIAAFTRLEWVKRRHTNKNVSVEKQALDPQSIGKVSVLEVTVPSVFKAVISLFPSGCMIPDAISVFSADETCSNAHLGSTSSHAVFRRVTECATSALQRLLEFAQPSTLSLNLLLHWLYMYKSLFSKPCSQCKKILSLDHSSEVLLPALVRPCHQVTKVCTSVSSVKIEELSDDKIVVYHLSCIPKDEISNINKFH